jgi:hypothetical protein
VVEIQDDLRVIADFDQKIIEATRNAGSPRGIQEKPALTHALSHETQWAATHCAR